MATHGVLCAGKLGKGPEEMRRLASEQLQHTVHTVMPGFPQYAVTSCAGKLGKGPEEMRRLASELASELEGSARLTDAALVTLEYLQVSHPLGHPLTQADSLYEPLCRCGLAACTVLCSVPRCWCT